MANIFNTNKMPVNHTDCTWELLKTMVAGGWSILAWADGTTLYPGGIGASGTVPGPYSTGPGNPDPIYPLTASGGGGAFPSGSQRVAGGIGNDKAWILLRQPKGTGSYGNYGGTRMFTFQRSPTAGWGSGYWRIKYSKSGTFSVPVSVTMSMTPSASDEVVVLGGNTDATPTYQTLFGSNDGATRFNCMVNDGMSGEPYPFGIWMTGFVGGGGSYPNGAFLFDPLVGSSVHPLDVDPFIVYAQGKAAGCFNCNNSQQDGYFGEATDAPYAWFRYGMTNPTGSNFQVSALFYGAKVAGSTLIQYVPGGSTTAPVGTNAFNGFDDLFPVIYARRGNLGGLTGYKGISSLVRLTTANRSPVGDTLTLNTARDKVIMGDAVIDWDGSVPIL